MLLSESLETKASVEIDNIINRVFQSVISQYSAKLVEITLRGVRELLFAIKSSKAMGPDRIGLNELTININITADILVLLSITLPKERKMVFWLLRYINMEVKPHLTIGLYPLYAHVVSFLSLRLPTICMIR